MRNERIDLRVTREEKTAWRKSAQANKLKLADWIRGRCNPTMPLHSEPFSKMEPLPPWEVAMDGVMNTLVNERRNDRKPCKHGLLFCKTCK